MKVAVVGAGLFGSLTAVRLAETGARVTLYDRLPGLLLGATRSNQARIHRGYHYPRDPNVAELSRHADRLIGLFPTAVTRAMHHYLVADDSPTSAEQYEKAILDAGLAWTPVANSLVAQDAVQVCLNVEEAYLGVDETRRILQQQIAEFGVRCRFNTDVDPAELVGQYDHVVDATYGRHWPDPLRYEVCETVFIKVGVRFQGASFVVMDGDYCSLDPRGDEHLLYDVKHSVHAVNHIPDHLAPLLNRGRVQTPHTRLADMLDTAQRFLRGVGAAEYRGSLFTVRAVLPDDGTDARPTLVRTEGNLTRILSGKLCAAPWAADQVAAAC